MLSKLSILSYVFTRSWLTSRYSEHVMYVQSVDPSGVVPRTWPYYNAFLNFITSRYSWTSLRLKKFYRRIVVGVNVAEHTTHNWRSSSMLSRLEFSALQGPSRTALPAILTSLGFTDKQRSHSCRRSSCHVLDLLCWMSRLLFFYCVRVVEWQFTVWTLIVDNRKR